ncbi:hypothetical protein CFP71_01690 [Amycolatopsis thailandensis]|uniref:LamG-like jellyroll fold domain-containing protein n=1 Tax=Amycolatopsis thailandensis TaxID=589330 RepID=A0A229SIJ3_9PSEU|nr:LamG domain-containing protein [Amycolatopsis thailandensis]OXM58604.1 hypothetical protein CFP71_01690 [Amycolatopsis thailandensis]
MLEQGSTEDRLKTYSDHTYLHTAMVRHQGTVIAFAIDDRRRIRYSVLDLDSAAGSRGAGGEIDARHWADDPCQLVFPREITRAGYATLGAERLPRVRLGGRVEVDPGDVVPDDEIDGFLSGTGRLTAAVPFQVVSDGKHVFVFRQAVDAADANAVFRTDQGSLTGERGADGAAVAAGALLCDRFVLAGDRLLPVQEVRYRRSRHRDRPASAKDSLGIADMDDKPFHEPTLELGFAGRVADGRFTVLLLPTAMAGTSRWQFFVAGNDSSRIDAINVEQGADGLFDTQGTLLYTSPEAEYRNSVLEREPGTCPFSKKPLVPVEPDTRFAESALRLSGGGWADAEAPSGLGEGPYTLEAWINWDGAEGVVLSTGKRGMSLSVTADGRLKANHVGSTRTTAEGLVTAGCYVHIAAVFDGTRVTLVVDGAVQDAQTLRVAEAPEKLWLGQEPGKPKFAGVLDEVRVWSRARRTDRIVETRERRLVGDEPELAAYYRFDEGIGATCYDQGPRAAHATIRGTTEWVVSDAPLADHAGIRRDSFAVTGRNLTGGLSAVFYHQQEEGTVGDGAVRPLKRQARVLVTWATSGNGADDSRIAALDLAVARDGRIAQLPDVLDLPVLGSAVEEVDPGEENVLRGKLDTLRQRLRTAEQGKMELQADVKNRGRVTTALTRALAEATSLVLGNAKPPVALMYLHNDQAGFRHLTVGENSEDLIAPAGAGAGTSERAQWEWDSSQRKIKSVKAGKYLTGKENRKDFFLGDGRVLSFDAETEKNATAGKSLTCKCSTPSGWFSSQTLVWEDGRPVIHGTGTYAYNNKTYRQLKVFLVPAAPSGDAETRAVAAVKAAFVRLNTASDAKAALDAWDAEITAVNTEIENAQRRLGVITDYVTGRSTRALPMVHLGQDRLGLGWSGALLDFAAVEGSPLLSVGGTGQLGLYYRDTSDRFTGVFYDTNVDRSTKKVAATCGTTILLSARDASVDLATVTVTVGPARNAVEGRCSLTVDIEGGDTETWQLLSRNAQDFAAALNGQRSEPLPVGTTTGAGDGVLTLSAPGADRPLSAGDLLTVGDLACTVAEAVQRTATSVRVHENISALAAGLPVRLVSYDPGLVGHVRPGAEARYGSRYVTATVISTAGEAGGSVSDGTATAGGEARLPQWWSDLPGRALSFGPETTPPALDTARHLAAARLIDNLTVEAWVKPAAGTTTEESRRIVHVNTGDTSADSSFTLGFGAATATEPGARALVAGVGDRFVTTTTTVAADRWTHVAAAFEQSWALRFANGVYAEARHAADLDIGRELTLEVFLRADSLGGAQGLLSKGHIDDGRGRRVPYQLGVAGDGKLVFSFQGRDGETVRLVSERAITAGTFHRIAVVRRLGDSREEKKGTRDISVLNAAGTATKMVVDTIEALTVKHWSEISFHIDGATAGAVRHDDAPELSHPGPLEIGRVRRGAVTEAFTGEISEIRVWNVARDRKDLGADLPVPSVGQDAATADSFEAAVRPEGLVAHWRFEENEGNAATDESGSHAVRLHGAKWTKNPDPRGSRFRLYLDGQAVQATPVDGGLDYGPPQFSLGGRTASSGVADHYQGILEEVRIWRTARTGEQILDNLFGRLTGEISDLLAYYPFDDESTEATATELADHGPRGLALALAGERDRPVALMSTAPISSETPQVRPVFATGQPRFVQRIGATPAVAEYADLQRLPDRATRGVLKRAYAYVRDGVWNLITGHKLGDLVSEWVSQVQFDPQVIGYIEGAPPIPGENLVATRRPGSQSYINATMVEFTQADGVEQILSSGDEGTMEASLAMKLGAQFKGTHRFVNAPLGIGVSMPLVEWEANIGTGVELEWSTGWGNQVEVSQGVETGRSTSIGLSGGWEAEPATEAGKRAMIENGGRRFVPANTGYALVQSETADVFALRLAHTGAVVAYRMLPNPDIPRDWNLLPFKINPRYTKQGTLDGMAGFVKQGTEAWEKRMDDSYQGLGDHGEFSYFKPAEAYRLKRRITEDQQRRQAYYAGLSTADSVQDRAQSRAEDLLSRFTGPLSGQGKGNASKEASGYARRDIVNTYVWSADGGFFAESTGFTDVVTETTTGAYSFKGMGTTGVSAEAVVGGAVGVNFQLDASFGGSINRTHATSTESTRSFSLDVTVDTPGDMQKYDKDYNPVFDGDGNAVEIPGRVDAYRFMTFYLDSDKANFDDFYGKVVDGTWLDSADPNALALKQAQQSEHKPPCWRVLHRVTFVSRKLPPLLTGDAPPLEKAMHTADIGSNYELVRRLEPYVDRSVADRAELHRQVAAAIGRVLPELAPHTKVIADLFADYLDVS